MSHGTHTDESWYVDRRVTAAHDPLPATAPIYESYKYKRVVVHVLMTHGAHMDESWHTDGRVTAAHHESPETAPTNESYG